MKPTADMSRFAVSGFTLIEALTTIVIIGVLAGLAVPSFSRLIDNQRVRNASFDLSSALLFAREEATKRNANVTIKATSNASNNWQSGWQITYNNGGGDVVLQNQSAYTNVTISANNSNYSSIVFGHSGRVSNMSGNTTPSFMLTSVGGSGHTTRCLLVDASGRVNVTC